MYVALGIHDWLLNEKPATFCNSGVKKTVLVTLTFLLVFALATVMYAFHDKFRLPFPTNVHAVLFLIEILSILCFIYGIFNENRFLIVPLLITQVVRILIVAALIMYYIYRMITVDSTTTPSLLIPALKYDNTHKTAKFIGDLLMHLVFVLFAHVVVAYIAINCYVAFKSKRDQQERGHYDFTRAMHNITIDDERDKP